MRTRTGIWGMSICTEVSKSRIIRRAKGDTGEQPLDRRREARQQRRSQCIAAPQCRYGRKYVVDTTVDLDAVVWPVHNPIPLHTTPPTHLPLPLTAAPNALRAW